MLTRVFKFFCSWKTVAKTRVLLRTFLCVCLEGTPKRRPGESAEKLESGCLGTLLTPVTQREC